MQNQSPDTIGLLARIITDPQVDARLQECTIAFESDDWPSLFHSVLGSFDDFVCNLRAFVEHMSPEERERLEAEQKFEADMDLAAAAIGRLRHALKHLSTA